MNLTSALLAVYLSEGAAESRAGQIGGKQGRQPLPVQSVVKLSYQMKSVLQSVVNFDE